LQQPLQHLRSPKRQSPAAKLVAPLIVAFWLLLPTAPVHAFGTLGQRAEHERITRAALACPPDVKSTGDCFEPRSLDQLAGDVGTVGAVGAPDIDEFFTPAAHCDNADFLDIPGYPQPRAAATANLLACVAHLRMRFWRGIDGASGLFDRDGELIGPEVDLSAGCTFVGGFAGKAKCNAIEGLGRALHGAQDFYSHSNWADESDPNKPIWLDNPPGLNLPGPTPILDLAGNATPAIPPDLTTGFFSVIDKCPGTNRVTHACLNKDEALIDPATGAVSDPLTARGLVANNEQKAVTGAIAETRRQWADFRATLNERYGAELGTKMALAIAQDVPKVDLVFAIDTTGSMDTHIADVVAAANDVVDALSGRGTPPILTDYRIGVVDYKDVDSILPTGCSPNYDAVVDLPFSTHRTDIVDALSRLRSKVYGGCDIPEDVLSGVQRAVHFPWRGGVKKAIIVMGDAPGHDPERHSGLTSASVIAAALAVDPAIVYPILVGSFSTDAFMTNLALGTGGQTFDGRTSGGVAQALLAAITAIVTPPPKVDLVFAIDTTASMGPYIAEAVAAANDVIDGLSGTNYRVGVVDYKDGSNCTNYRAVIDLPFSTSRTDIVAALSRLRSKVFGGCDFPEDVLSGVQLAIDFPWRDGVNKAIIVMGDAPGHDPEPSSGLTLASVIAAALAVDPAIVYPVLIGRVGSFGADAFMTNLALGTGGQTFDGRTSGGVAQALLAAITAIVTTPPGDKTAPVTTASLAPAAVNGWNNSPPTVTLSADDGTGSGVDKTEYSLDGGAFTTYTAAFQVSGDGIHTLEYRSTDRAGNAEATASLAIRVDTGAPEASLQINTGSDSLDVFGSDGLSGTSSAPIAPSSSVPTKWGKKDDPTIVEDPPHPNALALTYVVTDLAGNTITLVVKVKDDRPGGKNDFEFRIVTLRYNGGPVIDAEENHGKFRWSGDKKTDVLRDLHQTLEVRTAEGKFKLDANYDGKKKETTKIKLKEPGPDTKLTVPGLVLIRLVTLEGGLTFEF